MWLIRHWYAKTAVRNSSLQKASKLSTKKKASRMSLKDVLNAEEQENSSTIAKEVTEDKQRKKPYRFFYKVFCYLIY